MEIYVAADHGGIKIKNKIMYYLRDKGYAVVDMGAYEYNTEDDYPDFVIPAMERLQENHENLAIIACRNGVGVSILANKFDGIRCGLCFTKDHTISAKTDDGINVLALPADYISAVEVFQIVDAFLETPFNNAKRHIRRLKKVTDVMAKRRVVVVKDLNEANRLTQE